MNRRTLLKRLAMIPASLALAGELLGDGRAEFCGDLDHDQLFSSEWNCTYLCEKDLEKWVEDDLGELLDAARRHRLMHGTWAN